jgi:hypothetical protein
VEVGDEFAGVIELGIEDPGSLLIGALITFPPHEVEKLTGLPAFIDL